MTPPAPTAASRRLIAVLALISCFGPLATDMYLSALPTLRADLHTDAAGAGSTLSIFLLGMAIGQLLFGPLSDRFGRKKMLLAGAALYTVASFLCVFSQDIVTFDILRLLQAMGATSGQTLGRAIVRDLFEGRRIAELFSILSVIGMAAPLLAPLLGIGVILLGGWRMVFIVLTLLGIACLLAVHFGLSESLPPERRTRRLGLRSTIGGFGELLAHPRFLTAALATACASGILFAYITGSPLLFIDHFGFSRVGFTLLFTLAVMGMMGGGQINRRLLARHNGPDIMRRAVTTAIPVALLMIAATGTNAYLLCAALMAMTCCVGFMLPNGVAATMMATDRAGMASALLGVMQFGTGFLSSMLVTFAGAHSPMGMALVIAGFAVAAWLLWRRHEHLDDGSAVPLRR
jgi:DHA1 family bicyclomycin/chloramphenicol resistance-like MFS transporter